MQPHVICSVDNPVVSSEGKEPYSILAVAPNGELLAIVYKNNIQLWRIATQELLDTITGAHSGAITALSWASDSSKFLSSCSDCVIRVFNSPTIKN